MHCGGRKLGGPVLFPIIFPGLSLSWRPSDTRRSWQRHPCTPPPLHSSPGLSPTVSVYEGSQGTADQLLVTERERVKKFLKASV